MNGNGSTSDPVYSRINKSNSSSLIKESADRADVESASLTWLQKQQKKLEERRAVQRRRDGPHFSSNSGGNNLSDNSKESNLLRELKTSLDRARSETTDGYAASETASLFFSETSTRESSPHKPRIVPIQIEQPQNGFQRTSTPKTASENATAASSSISRSGAASESATSLARHASDTSYDRTRPLIQRRLRYDSEGEQSANGLGNGNGGHGGGLINSGVSNTSIDSINSRPITPGFPTVPPTPIFGQPAAG